MAPHCNTKVYKLFYDEREQGEFIMIDDMIKILYLMRILMKKLDFANPMNAVQMINTQTSWEKWCSW